MSFWNEDHPMQWKYEQVQAAIPAWGEAETEDLTEFANLINLVHDYYNNGSLAANIEARYSRYMQECEYGNQMCKDWFETVKYWYDNDCMPDDEDQEWYATNWVETMLNCIDFEYDESKNPANMKKSPKTPKPKKANEVVVLLESKKYDNFRPKPAMPDLKKVQEKAIERMDKMYKSPESPESPEKDKFKVSKKEFAEFRLCQKGALPMPEWFVKDKTKQNEVIERTDEIAAYYKI